MTSNRYSELKLSGTPIKRTLKRIWSHLFWRPYRQCLGPNTYVQPPFACNAPARLTVGARCTVSGGLNIQLLTEWFEQRFDPHVSIDDDTYIGFNCEIVSVSGIHIGRGCTLSDNVYINDSSHGFDPRDGLLMDRPLTTKGPIAIGNGCFLGRGAIVLSGVTLGEHCVVGAGCLVTRSAPAYSRITGNPGRVTACFDLASGSWQRPT